MKFFRRRRSRRRSANRDRSAGPGGEGRSLRWRACLCHPDAPWRARRPCAGCRPAVGRAQHGAQPLSPGRHPAHRRLHRRPAEPDTAARLLPLPGVRVGVLVTIALLGVITALGATGGRHRPGTLPGGRPLLPGRLAPARRDPLPPRRGAHEDPAAGATGRPGPRLVFGIALGPCTFAFMAPVLGPPCRARRRRLRCTALLVAYGIGHCAVIVAAGASTETVQRYLNWNNDPGGQHRAQGVWRPRPPLAAWRSRTAATNAPRE